MSELMEGSSPAAPDLDRFIAELSTTSNLQAESVDDRIERVIAMIAELAGADRVIVAQLTEDGARFRPTHQWAREGLPRLEDNESVDAYPWSSWQIFRARRGLVLSELDDLPAEAARDRESFERVG